MKALEKRPILLALRQVLLDQFMKSFGVVHMDHVGEFVDNDVVNALFWCLHKVDVKGDDPVASAVSPLAFHASEFHLFGLKAHSVSILF